MDSWIITKIEYLEISSIVQRLVYKIKIKRSLSGVDFRFQLWNCFWLHLVSWFRAGWTTQWTDYSYLPNNLKPKNSPVLFFGFVVCILKSSSLPGCELHMLAVTVLSCSCFWGMCSLSAGFFDMLNLGVLNLPESQWFERSTMRRVVEY